MKSSRAASPACESITNPRTWGGFGDHKPLKTTKCVRLSVQFFHKDAPSARLAVWAYVVPTGTMQHSVLLGRDSRMRFNTISYHTLSRPHKSGRILGELTLNHVDRSGCLLYTSPSPRDA